MAAGLSAAAIQSFVLKVAGFFTQIVCASFLEKEEFGEVAVGLGIVALFNFAAALNLNAACLRRGRAACRWEISACCCALLCGVVCMIVMYATAPTLVSWFNGNENALTFILLGSLTLIPSSLIGVRCAVLKGSYKFGEAAKIASYRSVAVSIGTVLLAICGLGSLSFIIPRIAITWVLTLILFRGRVGELLNPLPSLILRMGEILRVGALSIPGFFSLYITTQLDKLVVAKSFSLSEAGLYFFAYNLSAQAIFVAGQIVRESIIPVLAREKNSSVQAERFAKIIRTTLVFTSPLLMIQAVMICPVLDILYGDKWDEAAPLIQILSVAMAVRMGGIASSSLLKIQNRFGLISCLNGIYGFLFVGVVAVASQSQDIQMVTWAVVLFYTIISAFHFFVPICNIAKNPFSLTLRTFSAVPLALFCFGVSLFAVSTLFGWQTSLSAVMSSVLGLCLFSLAVFWNDSELLNQIRSFAKKLTKDDVSNETSVVFENDDRRN